MIPYAAVFAVLAVITYRRTRRRLEEGRRELNGSE